MHAELLMMEWFLFTCSQQVHVPPPNIPDYQPTANKFIMGVIGSPDVGIPGPSGADSRRLVSWSWLWACPARCKRSPPARLGRNAGRVRFQRAWLARRNSRARRSLARARGIQESSEPISFLAETGRSETLNKTNDLACKRPGPRELGSQHAGLAA
jgi:hypothetical protein